MERQNENEAENQNEDENITNGREQIHNEQNQSKRKGKVKKELMN
jgi:hypothetical protein